MIIYSDSWKVYVHQNKINGKMYIGITSVSLNKRFERNGTGYRNHNIKFWRAIQKYGWGNFEHILIASNLTEKEANNMEALLINKLDTIHNGYNCREGGKAGKLSDETKQIIKEKRAKQVINYDAVMRAAEKNKGIKRTEEFKKAVKEAKRPFMKKVLCIETEEMFESITAASKSLNMTKSFVSQVCNRVVSSAHGYHLCFVDSND